MSTHSDRRRSRSLTATCDSAARSRPHGATVTNHALVRWLERAEGRDLSVMRAAFERVHGHAPDDTEILHFLAAYTGERIGVIRSRILTPTLKAAIALGARKVRRGRVWLVIAGGAVVTVLYRRRLVLFQEAKAPGRWRSTKGRQAAFAFEM